MRKHIASIVSYFALACGLPAAGQTDTLTVHLKGVSVSADAQRKELKSTAPLHVIDASDIRLGGVADISDAMHRLPGVTLRDYGGAGGLKTVSVRGFGASHTAVVYDGIVLSDCQSGQIDVSRYSLDNMGALSMTVGDNDDIYIPARAAASAAVLAISTLPHTDSLAITAQLRAGSFGFLNPYLRLSTGAGQHVIVSAVGEFIHSDNDYPFKLRNGDLTTEERRNNSRMNSGHGEVNLLWRPASRTSLTTKIYFYDNARRLPGPVIYYNNVNKERLHESNMFAQMQLRTVLSDKWSLQGNAKVNYAVSKYHDENGKYPGGTLDQNYWQREAYASVCLLFVPMRELAMDYSADYSFNNLNSNLPTDIRPYRNSLLQSLTARYRNRSLTVMARALLSCHDNGSRTGEAAKDATRLSPSVSVAWQPWTEREVFVRASYKNIFRMPTFSESYFDHYGSATLRPETTEQFNVGLTFQNRPSGRMPFASVTLDGYMNHIDDMIVAVPYNMFLWTVVNLNRVRVFGIDATVNLTFPFSRAGHSLVVAGNYSYQRAQPRTDAGSSEWMKQVAYIPKNSGNLSVGFECPAIGVSANCTGVSARYTTNNNIPSTRIDGYMELGASAWHIFPLRRSSTLEARINVLNLLDKQYEVVARYPMPGRALQVALKFNY